MLKSETNNLDPASSFAAESVLSAYGVADKTLGPGNLAGKLEFLHYRELSALHYAATHDALTGLLNRRGLNEMLEEAVTPPQAVLVVDGDQIKRINDELGHERGDEIITSTANALLECVRPEDIVARTGGDEFMVVFKDAPRENGEKTHLTPKELVMLTSERISNQAANILSDPANADLAQRGIKYGMSVGGAVWQEGLKTSDLVAMADSNMYVQKRAKKVSRD